MWTGTLATFTLEQLALADHGYASTAHNILLNVYPREAAGSLIAYVSGNNSSVNSAYEGTVISLIPTANEGYTLESVTYTYDNITTDITSVLQFTMPDVDVTVNATFTGTGGEDLPVVALKVNRSDKTALSTPGQYMGEYAIHRCQRRRRCHVP